MTPGACPPRLRADLHVHSNHSGFTQTLRLFASRDCYSSPEAVYRRARTRGMDLVTITDHDSIDGCLELFDRHPDAHDIIMGEEIECRVPDSATRVHLGAFGLTEQHHRDVQSMRGDVFEAAEFLRSHRVALVLHHPFHFFRGEMKVRTYLDRLLPLVHAVEVRNATMVSTHNNLAAATTVAWNRSAARGRLGQTGGSDAHVAHHVATAFTEAPGRTREEFLDSLLRGESRAAGVHGSTGRLALEVYGVILNYWAALVGLKPSGLTRRQRAARIGYSVLSLPFQFVPLVVSMTSRRGEQRRMERWRRELERPVRNEDVSHLKAWRP